jgi:hypothetical protein
MSLSDLSNISCLFDRVKLDKVPIRRSCETPRLWSTCRRRDLSSSNVKVNVQVSNGQRRVTTSQSHSETGPMKKGSGKPSGYRKRDMFRGTDDNGVRFWNLSEVISCH